MQSKKVFVQNIHMLEFHPDVEKEVLASYSWYEKQSPGLGEDFLSELDEAYLSISEIPKVWPLISKNYRRYLLKRFPFGVIYRMDSDAIYAVAVMHLSREPGYWENRV